MYVLGAKHCFLGMNKALQDPSLHGAYGLHSLGAVNKQINKQTRYYVKGQKLLLLRKT